MKLVALIVGIILTPIFLFPAFSQEVSLYGSTNAIWLGLLAICLAAFTATRLIKPLSSFFYSRRQVGAVDLVVSKIQRLNISGYALFGVYCITFLLFSYGMKQIYERQKGVKNIVKYCGCASGTGDVARSSTKPYLGPSNQTFLASNSAIKVSPH